MQLRAAIVYKCPKGMNGQTFSQCMQTMKGIDQGNNIFNNARTTNLTELLKRYHKLKYSTIQIPIYFKGLISIINFLFWWGMLSY